jgi:hypothetical protein
LKQRIALRCELRPLSLNEAMAYIAGRIRAAGGVAAQIFTREAVALIHDRAHGIPRTINVLADNALVAWFATETRPVTSALVREVCQDFDIEVMPSHDDDVDGTADLLEVQATAPPSLLERAGVAPPDPHVSMEPEHVDANGETADKDTRGFVLKRPFSFLTR